MSVILPSTAVWNTTMSIVPNVVYKSDMEVYTQLAVVWVAYVFLALMVIYGIHLYMIQKKEEWKEEIENKEEENSYEYRGQ